MSSASRHIVLTSPAHPDDGGDLIFRQSDALALEILGLLMPRSVRYNAEWRNSRLTKRDADESDLPLSVMRK